MIQEKVAAAGGRGGDGDRGGRLERQMTMTMATIAMAAVFDVDNITFFITSLMCST